MRFVAFVLAILVSGFSFGQAYPTKPVRVIVPFSPGGVADSSARAVSERLGARLGHSGSVTKLGDATLILVAHPSVPARDVRELISLKKDFSYGTAGTGSTPHLAGELLAQRTGIALIHVPYKGGGQAMGDVVGGQIPLVYTAIATAQQFVKSGKLKGLGVSSAKRSPSLPDVPTFVENGLAGFVVDSWVGILAPAKTPRAVLERLQKEIAALLKEPEMRERYATLGIEPVGNTPEQYTEQIRADLARWEKVVKQANIRIE
jgi:tripartite-type tricarboxylate transporter receptor subunit TctC